MNRRDFLSMATAASMNPIFSRLELLASEREQASPAKGVHITAFGPYEGLAINPSQEVAEHLSVLGYPITVLPVDYDNAPIILRHIIKSNPRVVVSLGLDGGSVYNPDYYFNVEIVANNIRYGYVRYTGDVLTYLRIDRKIMEHVIDRVSMPTSSVEYLQDKFDALGIKYKLSTSAFISQCNSLLFEGIMSTLSSMTKFYFFHVPRDIYANSAKRDNIVRAIETLAE